MGARGDAIVEFDAAVGQLLETLDRLKLTDSTLVIVSSDNGPVLDDGYQDKAVEKLGDHKPAGSLHGGKGTIWEGGTRVPFIVSWPGRVKPGVSDALVCQIDSCASLAALVRAELGSNDAPDSFNVLPALLGDSKAGRDSLLEQANRIALRQGNWKLVAADAKNPSVELYDLGTDPGEMINVADRQPEIVGQLTNKMTELRQQLRSRP